MSITRLIIRFARQITAIQMSHLDIFPYRTYHGYHYLNVKDLPMITIEG